ncbi:hypothetical protein BG011_006438 [Mortierella polycephala]|uniref:Pre-mRNA-splicing factor SYF2 n=1 Tax=Mortierella polycephala TaxID=41804 RepID=A0A9P6TZY4_9FUNG|nr:hypothetical protein BG011_006438 [Mortierella polycephala]
MPPKRKAPAAKPKTRLAAGKAHAAALEKKPTKQEAQVKAAKEATVAAQQAMSESSSTTTVTHTVTTTVSTLMEEEEDAGSQHAKKKSRTVKNKKITKKDAEEPLEAADKSADKSVDKSVDKDQDKKEEKEEEDASSSSTKNDSASLTMAERMEKLKGLRQKLNASKQANRADMMTEHQKSKVNPREEHKKERAREAAEKLMVKRDAEEAGEDFERAQFWGYSAESVERWNEKQEAKKNRMDNKFTDWDQVNHKKYLKQVGELKPNLAAYNAKKEAAMHTNEDGELVVSSDSGFYRDANSVEFLSDANPSTLAVDRMAADVAKQIDARTRFSKRRAHKEDEDVNYINDANQRFNQKISRFYDKYTKDIRDDFERGTAL